MMDDLVTPNPFLEIAVGTLILIAVIFVHGSGIRIINRRFSNSWVRITDTTPHWRLNLLLAVTIDSLAALHVAETLIWAVPLSLRI